MAQPPLIGGYLLNERWEAMLKSSCEVVAIGRYDTAFDPNFITYFDASMPQFHYLCEELRSMVSCLSERETTKVGFAFVRQPSFQGFIGGYVWKDHEQHCYASSRRLIPLTHGTDTDFRYQYRCPLTTLEVPADDLLDLYTGRKFLQVRFGETKERYIAVTLWSGAALVAQRRWKKLRSYWFNRSEFSARVKAQVDIWLLKNGMQDAIDVKRRMTHHL